MGVFRREIGACADAAAILGAGHEPFDALANWVKRYAAFVATKRGLGKVLHPGDPVFDPLPVYFDQRLRPAVQGLLESEANAGQVRRDVNANDLLFAVAACACQPTAMALLMRSGWLPFWSTGFAFRPA